MFWICDQKVLITHLCFSYYWTAFAQHQGLLWFSVCPPRLRMCSRLGLRQMIQTNQRDIPPQYICTVIKRRKRGFYKVNHFLLRTGCVLVYPWEMLSDCLCIVYFVIFLFLYLLNNFYLNPEVLLLLLFLSFLLLFFALPFLLSFPTGVREWGVSKHLCGA